MSDEFLQVDKKNLQQSELKYILIFLLKKRNY